MQRIKQIDRRIEKIKRELEQIDEMRPGSISLQYQDAENKSYPYHQLLSTDAIIQEILSILTHQRHPTDV